MNKKLVLGAMSMLTASLLFSCNSENKQATQTSSEQTAAPAEDPHAGQTAHTPAQDTPPMTKEIARVLPADFTFYKLKSGISFGKVDLAKDKNSVFVLFDPGCSHCQHEATALSDNYDKIKGVNVYFVSMNDPALMASFFDTFGPKLNGKSNVELLYDRNQEFIQKFHVPSQFPANYVYGPDGQLKEHWEGDKNINEIIAAYTK
ncbi:Gram-positive signal peptide protein, YSIRK family [Sphingobacterium spiritivorum ATCC 33300]|uniref:Gram-positive signal peptide protein, YSIRK family n=1 Tax=Sphingobacterium spiritivorum ATCC 33300 TaxID=525372 RepID=C2G443_SPHSI|nr:redoxin domain-containing protein [Sphingobacterium spiritivorum]EEI90057.1 Gram-positive signal peptide protein, YSIRK family [Sphingobacterium spiritivorum ATCC 33300]QQS94924.1 redoxin domain-containing protein [Sphingobacterium spiritivorum]